MGVAANTIRNWRDGGFLHPKKELRLLANGARRVVEVYDPNELRRRSNPRDTNEGPVTVGETAARAFQLFDDGVALVDVVVRLQECPQRVEELHDQWVRMGGSERVINDAAKVELEKVVGPFNGVADLIDCVKRLANPAAEPG